MNAAANQISVLSTEILKIVVDAAKGHRNRNAYIQRATDSLKQKFHKHHVTVRKLNLKHALSREELQARLIFGTAVVSNIAVSMVVFRSGTIESYNCVKPKHVSYSSDVQPVSKPLSRFQQFKQRDESFIFSFELGNYCINFVWRASGTMESNINRIQYLNKYSAGPNSIDLLAIRAHHSTTNEC